MAYSELQQLLYDIQKLENALDGGNIVSIIERAREVVQQARNVGPGD